MKTTDFKNLKKINFYDHSINNLNDTSCNFNNNSSSQSLIEDNNMHNLSNNNDAFIKKEIVKNDIAIYLDVKNNNFNAKGSPSYTSNNSSNLFEKRNFTIKFMKKMKVF